MHKVINVEALPEYKLFVQFDDGTEGEVSIADRLFGPIFEPLKDENLFKQVQVDTFGVVSWPNEADLDSGSLYQKLKSH